MLVREGEERSNDVDQKLACTLAAIAGALNTAAFYAVGFFAANMTGNVSSFSNNLALGNIVVGLFFLMIVSTFVAGAAVSTLLINAGRRKGINGIYAYSILLEAGLLALLGCADLWLPVGDRTPVLVLGLSFLMGLQNAVVTRISDARVRTTHVSGMSTDIGIELGMLIDIASGRESGANAGHYRDKLRLHGMTVLSFFAGGIVGVLVYRALEGAMLIATAALLFAIAMNGLVGARRLRILSQTE
ncbi:YoaK family protein [Labrys monachus]|uniref:Uncharacterized membrane protein YoaK (UPF0700 family) n=1 Tax=Labrys monachus TaxID=217067 RepID=A0ABU0FFC7_9HYPH|nr:YoaK family protein [Labrys monachus]MDQ0393311.1 uncharacterized membrane protein YoaK (UPF0700 family) [Labrys monachus]